MFFRLLSLLLRPLSDNCEQTIGGQAVMEGVMMRNGQTYALAVRHPDGYIVAERKEWFTICKYEWMKKPFLRGFPILLETMVNGIKALNRSAEIASEGEVEKLENWHIVLTLIFALGMAITLFVITPHLMSIGMQWLGFGGGVEGLSFHLWDGLFKFVIFIGYIVLISFVPDIRRVFKYHGAEHKVIGAFENGGEVNVQEAERMSRLHPRCGTTFMLFVISISIIIHAIFVPTIFLIWVPEGAVYKHVVTILFKLLLMIPISAMAYELIRWAAHGDDSILGTILRGPGLLLQMLTTYEPEAEQIEVAIVALYESLGSDAPDRIHAPEFRSAS